ncbi:MAG TPA: L,D-transpeptidase [Rhizomicrobium sp.]
MAAVAFAAMGGVGELAQHRLHQPARFVALKTFAEHSARQIAQLVPLQPNQMPDNARPRVDILIPAQPAATIHLRGSIVAAPRRATVLAYLQTPSSAARRARQVEAKPELAAKPKPQERGHDTASDTAPFAMPHKADLANAVAVRVRDSVPASLFPYFQVYLYVSKAAHGPWAQHMFIFHKSADDRLEFEQAIPVSTGRERHEKYFTSTPTGLFELDPNRFDRNHRSHRWNNAPMPWAMFLDYTIHNHLAGIALHSGVGHVALLGRRASGGCVRLPPQMARMLFRRFQAHEHGMVPVFAFNHNHATTRTDGTLQLGADGRPVMTPGYKVLLIIQDYRGAPPLVAELS